MKKLFFFVTIILSLFLLFSCQGKEKATQPNEVVSPVVNTADAKNEKIKVSIYFWDVAPLKALTPQLEAKFPDVEFEIVSAINDIEYFNFLKDHDALPDIIGMRKFSLNDAKYLKEELLDLSRTEVAATFHPSYLEQNRDEDGSIRWLPTCAELEGIIVNKEFLDNLNLSLPTTFDELLNCINILKENGLTPFITDYAYDYSCLTISQGSNIPQLMSIDGVAWRQKYESEKAGEAVGLDREVWLPVFENLFKFFEATDVDESYLEFSTKDITNKFINKETVMIRGTGSDCFNFSKTMDVAFLPFFGETPRDSWVYSYPIAQYAVNKKVATDSRKYEVVMDILEEMLSLEGQLNTAYGAPMLSYTISSSPNLSSVFDPIADTVKANHIYMRIASTTFFTTTKNVVQGIIKGDYKTPEEAYDAFDSTLKSAKKSNTANIIYTSDVSYPYGLTENGNMAESSILNTIVKNVSLDPEKLTPIYDNSLDNSINFDIGIAITGLSISPVFEGPYTELQLRRLVNGRSTTVYFELTGEEVDSLMSELIDLRKNGNNPIRHRNFIPVTSGFSYKIKDNQDDSYTYLGSDLDKEKVYKVLLCGNFGVLNDYTFCGTPLSEGMQAKKKSINTMIWKMIIELAKNNVKFEKPNNYLTIE